MNIIHSAAELVAVCDQPIDSELQQLLGGYACALEEFGEDLQSTILIVDIGDTLAEIERVYGERLVAAGRFTFEVELITKHERYVDVVRIIADDGSGLVLLIEIATDTDSQLLAACENALAEKIP